MAHSVMVPPVSRWVERGANSAIFLCNGLGIGAWAASLPLLQARLHLTDGQLSLALLGFAAGAVLSMPLTGLAAPRIGVARATRLAALSYAIAMLGPGLAPGLPALVFSAFLLGLTNGALDVSMNGLASGIETRWGAPIMSSFHAAFSVGGLGGAALGAAMAPRSSPWVSAMSLVALINVALALAAWRALQDPSSAPTAATAAPRFVLPGRASAPASRSVCSARARSATGAASISPTISARRHPSPPPATAPFPQQ